MSIIMNHIIMVNCCRCIDDDPFTNPTPAIDDSICYNNASAPYLYIIRYHCRRMNERRKLSAFFIKQTHDGMPRAIVADCNKEVALAYPLVDIYKFSNDPISSHLFVIGIVNKIYLAIPPR